MGTTQDEAGRIWSDRAQDMTDEFLKDLNEHYEEYYGRGISQEEIEDLFRFGSGIYPEKPSDVKEKMGV